MIIPEYMDTIFNTTRLKSILSTFTFKRDVKESMRHGKFCYVTGITGAELLGYTSRPYKKGGDSTMHNKVLVA